MDPPLQALFPLQLISQAQDEPQSWVFPHELSPLQVMLHEPGPQLIWFPQELVPEHCTSQLLAVPQLIAPVHAFCPQITRHSAAFPQSISPVQAPGPHWISQGAPAGHETGPSQPVAQSMTHTEPTQVPLLHCFGSQVKAEASVSPASNRLASWTAASSSAPPSSTFGSTSGSKPTRQQDSAITISRSDKHLGTKSILPHHGPIYLVQNQSPCPPSQRGLRSCG